MSGLFGLLGGVLGLFYLIGLPILAFAALSRSSKLREDIVLLKEKLSGAERRIKQLENAQLGGTLPTAATAQRHGNISEHRTDSGSVQPQAAAISTTAVTPTQTESTAAREDQSSLDSRHSPAVTAHALPALNAQTESSVSPSESSVAPQHPTPRPSTPVSSSTPDVDDRPRPVITRHIEPAAKPSPALRRAQKNSSHDASPFSGLISWFFHGNPVAKIGVLLLFFGLAYLFKYAVDHALFPIELRLASAGAISLAVLAVGWRLRHRQALYSLILQGGGIGAFYITVFGAFRLYELVPHGLAFALMILICAASVALAVLQNAQSLAVVASLGGYMAPVLLSTGGGNHVALFSYYALLSAGILAVSVWQAWRPLNLVGFLFTFGVAMLWGWDNYRPELYTSSQLFLILNMAIFGILAGLFALRHQSHGHGFVDGSLVFGTPLVGFGLQYGITRHWEFGAAFSALGFAAFYLPLAYYLVRRWPQEGRRLAMSFLALGGGFATLAIPLALSAQWTALAWSLEGLGVLWAGLGQQHKRMAWSGTLLLALAAVSAGLAHVSGMDNPSFFLIFATLALTWLGAAYLWRQQDGDDTYATPLEIVLRAGGVIAWLWWLVEGAHRVLQSNDDRAALLALLTMTISVFVWRHIGIRFAWPQLRKTVLLLWPLAATALAVQLGAVEHPFASGSWNLAWPIAFAAALFLLRRDIEDYATFIIDGLHVGLMWAALCLSGAEILWHLRQMPWGWDEWRLAVWLGACALTVLLVLRAHAKGIWPIAARPLAYLLAGIAPVGIALCVSLLWGNVLDGRLPNWRYLPLINPQEEAAIFALLVLAMWRRQVKALLPSHRSAHQLSRLFLVVASAWWFNGALLRALAHIGNVDWDAAALWDSRLVQTVFALVWTLVALALMWVATRRAHRTVWFAGAALLGVVVAKLFLVDSAGGGGLARAVAFIGVAILVMLIGYVAPLPPKKVGMIGDISEHTA